VKVLVTALLLAAVGVHHSRGGGPDCAALVGDAARTCYAKQVSAALGAKPSGVEFKTSTVLLCPLHTRTGAWQ
jgi:hypothetical protein